MNVSGISTSNLPAKRKTYPKHLIAFRKGEESSPGDGEEAEEWEEEEGLPV